MENNVIKIEINDNGTFNIMDKVTDHKFKNINLYENISDVGDGYEFVPVVGDFPVTTAACKAEIEKIVETAFMGTLKISVTLNVPKAILENASWRDEDEVPLTINTLVTMGAGNNRRIDVKVKFYNNARDHRLSCVFPTGMRAKEVQVDGHFGITTREIKLPDSENWEVPPPHQAPQHRFVNLTDYSEEKGILIANKGLPEYEAKLAEDGLVTLGLTILRAVGGWGRHINRDSPVTVEYSQLIGPQEYEYSIIPHEGKMDGILYRQAMAFRYPIHAEYKGAYNKYQGYFPNVPKPEEFLPMSRSFFKLEPPNLVISSIKKAMDSDDMILRLFNLSKIDDVKGRLETTLKVKGVELNDLAENKIEDTSMEFEQDIDAINITVKKGKIITLRLKV